MDIKTLAKKPQLMEIIIDDEEIVKEYGEPITFYMKDFVDIATYFNYYQSQSQREGQALALMIKKMILNKDGEPVLGDEDELPLDITLAVMSKINDNLGKSKTKSSTPNDGTQPS